MRSRTGTSPGVFSMRPNSTRFGRPLLIRRRIGRNVESCETARRRGGVTLALCSLVLEAGLRCDEAAALKWRDVRQGENVAPAITIRKGPSEADRVVGVSFRAFAKISSTLRQNAPSRMRRSSRSSVRQIVIRVRYAARGAGLESQIEEDTLNCAAGTPRTAHGGGRETAAGPTAGTTAGRFGQQRVSVALETPHPLPGQEHERGSGVRERQGSLPEPSPTVSYRSRWDTRSSAGA